MKPKDCPNCETSEHLQPRYNSDDGVGWVHCDECGLASEAVLLGYGQNAIIKKWNELVDSRKAK